MAAQSLQQLIQAVHALHDDMLHTIDAFQAAIDLHQLGIDQHPVLAIGQVPPDHGVDHASLIFEREEGDAAGGLWALAHAYQAGDTHATAMAMARQLRGIQAATAAQLRAQERDRVAAEGVPVLR